MKTIVSKSLFTTVLCISFACSNLYAQYYYYNDDFYDTDLLWEIGGSVGTMYGMTDVGKKKFSTFQPSNVYKFAKVNGSFYVGLLYHDVIGLRAEITYGSIAGADSNGNAKARNLSYKTSIAEIAVLGEIHPFMLTYRETVPRISPYVAAGIGWFSFNPQANYKGTWVDLQPLRTEGQGFKEFPDRQPYKLSQFCLPFGGGLKYELSGLVNVRAEVLMRYTFTDYLDDASFYHIDGKIFYDYFSPQKAQLADALSNRYKEKDANANYTGAVPRGWPKTKDKYISFNIKVGVALGRQPIR